jgi:hypothetical protein
MIAPCACAGSIQFLHSECLREWRLLSPNQEYKDRCNICQQLYDLPRRWPLEHIDTPGRLWDDFLCNPMLTASFAYYAHLALHGFVPPLTNLEDRIILSYLYQTLPSRIIFFSVLFGMTGLYGLYFYPRMRRLQSPHIFVRALAPDLFPFLTIQFFFLYLVSVAIFPFGVLYLVGLSYSRGLYIGALERMNKEGEFDSP